VRRRAPGFTLIEVLVVIFIIAVLASLLLLGVQRYRQKAYIEGTQGTLSKVKSALEEYYGLFREYPPDGYDFPVFRESPTGGRAQIKGSACLIYFLALPTLQEYEVGTEKKYKENDPFLADLKLDQLSGTGDLDRRLGDPTTEILDAFGNPIHYDNTGYEAGAAGGGPGRRVRVSNQSAPAVHGPDITADQHGPDPRVGAGGGALQAKNAGKYDLWSHGPDVNDVKDDIWAGETD